MRSIILLFLIFLTNCIGDSTQCPDKEKAVNQVLLQIATQLKNDTGLIPYGSGGRMMYQVKMLALSFEYRKPMEIKEGRSLLIKAIDQMLMTINTNQEIRQFLEVYPRAIA